MSMPPKDRWQQLLLVAYWYEAGLHGRAPGWVQLHPMWPKNNDTYVSSVSKGHLATACQGRDRLWEAIAAEFKLDLSPDPMPGTPKLS